MTLLSRPSVVTGGTVATDFTVIDDNLHVGDEVAVATGNVVGPTGVTAGSKQYVLIQAAKADGTLSTVTTAEVAEDDFDHDAEIPQPDAGHVAIALGIVDDAAALSVDFSVAGLDGDESGDEAHVA